MSHRGEVTSTVYRWRSVTVRKHGSTNYVVADVVLEALGGEARSFCNVHVVDERDWAIAVRVEYPPSFDCQVRGILYDAIKVRFPAADVAFFGEQAVVTLSSAVCLGKYIQ